MVQTKFCQGGESVINLELASIAEQGYTYISLEVIDTQNAYIVYSIPSATGESDAWYSKLANLWK